MTAADRRIGGSADGDADPGTTAQPPNRPPTLPPTGRLLAVDWGEKRIGLAVTDPTRTIAQPLATLRRRAGRRFPLQQLRHHLDALQPVGIVVGLPLDEDGAYIHVKGGNASVYLGNENVTTENGFELEQGETISLFIGPDEGLYAVCEEGTVGVCYIATLNQ